MSDFLKSRTTVILISIIWGLGLAALFSISCKQGQGCSIINYVGPPLSITKQVWSYGEPDKCYTINSKIVEC